MTTTGQYRSWARHAFEFASAAFIPQVVRPYGHVSEELIRASFVEGFVGSDPKEAGRLLVEAEASWSKAPCRKPTCPKKGPKKRHDVWVAPSGEAKDAGLACEVKLLKAKRSSHDAIAQDIWRLALTRGTVAERSAVRTYLLVGAQRDPLSDALDRLRKAGAPLSWSQRGGQKTGSPATTSLDMMKFAKSKVGGDALSKVLRWGNKSTHFRTPPSCRASLRANARAAWETTIRGDGWRLVLWEVHAEGAGATSMDWASVSAAFATTC